MPTTNDEIAAKLVKGFKAHLAQRMLDADPAAVRDSNLWTIVRESDRPELMRLVEEMLRASLQDEVANAFEEFRTRK